MIFQQFIIKVKTNLKYFIAVVFVAISVFFANKIYKNYERNKLVAFYNKTLPNIKLQSIEERTISLAENNGKSKVLVFFDPFCDHCQTEATDFQKHISAFEEAEVTFISMDLMRYIKVFAFDYKLDKLPNVKFCQIDSEVLSTNFGPMGFPTIFIYNADNQMIGKFSGNVKISELADFLD